MPRRLIFIALLLSMLMQATTLGNLPAGPSKGREALHAVLHWAGLGHHHRQDRPAPPSQEEDAAGIEATGGLRVSAVADTASGGCDQDQSPESIRHVLMDGYVSGAAMISSWVGSLPTRLSRPIALRSAAEKVPATPFLEGWRRPPRAA